MTKTNHALILAFGLVAVAATGAHAQQAPTVPDPLSDAQSAFGTIVAANFRVPDPIVRSVSTPGSPVVALGGALRTSMEVPGAVFAGIFKPFADADNAATPTPAAPAPKPRRTARAHHRRAASQS